VLANKPQQIKIFRWRLLYQFLEHFRFRVGALTPISYVVGDTFMYNGKTRTVTQGVLDGQQNALAVQDIFNNQSWLNTKKGCHP
jgi:hypothetical protein